MSGKPSRDLASSEGRSAVFQELFLSNRDRVYALCLHITGGHAEAQDALQDTFLAAYRGLKGFRGEASLSTWLYRIALRSAATIKAKANRDVDLPADLLASTPGPDEAAEGRIQVERLTWALRRLSAEQQAILSLFAIDGISHIQIAEILGVPEGTVWSRLHGARKRLLEEIGAGNSRS